MKIIKFIAIALLVYGVTDLGLDTYVNLVNKTNPNMDFHKIMDIVVVGVVVLYPVITYWWYRICRFFGIYN